MNKLIIPVGAVFVALLAGWMVLTVAVATNGTNTAQQTTVASPPAPAVRPAVESATKSEITLEVVEKFPSGSSVELEVVQ